MNSNQIAEKFSNGGEVSFFLTRKQADWLLNTSMSESKAGSHFGRRWGKGEFRNETGLYRWEATEGYHGSANFKVIKINETTQQQSLQDFVTEKGHNFFEIMNTPLMIELAIEYSKKYASA